ncbi:MAG: hypothetical protein IKU82_02280 [Clostridia bacterium]|nr:hypothetical protein [Clostridia bacterium]
MKKLINIFLVLILAISLCSCSQMPFNGTIEFHDISLTIPERFIRDSTQSNDDLWIFEHSNYSEYVIISRKDVTGEVQSSFEDYVEYMHENGAESEIVTFLNDSAVLSTYYLEDVFCQEILFEYNNSFYAVALRGGTQSGFKEITDTINLIELTTNVVSE